MEEIKLTPELVEKAKAVKGVDELIKLGKENNIGLTEEDAKDIFDRLNPKLGELSDEELDNVSGGGCGRPSLGETYPCVSCGSTKTKVIKELNNGVVFECGRCKYQWVHICDSLWTW